MNIDETKSAQTDVPPSDPCSDHAEACRSCSAGEIARQTALRLRMLETLGGYAMEVAAAARQRYLARLERQREAAVALDEAADREVRALQQDFDRAGLAVRQIFWLQERIAQDHLARVERGAAAVAAERAEAAKRAEAQRQARLERRRGRVRRELEHVVKKECNPFEVNGLIHALNTRLAREHLDSDFGDAPLKEILLRICRDLHIPIEWAQWWDGDGDPEDLPNLPAPVGATSGGAAEKSEAGAATAPAAKRPPPMSPALAALLAHGRKFKGAFPEAGKPDAPGKPGPIHPSGRGPPWR